MLFDFVRAAFASLRTACTDLSRRLRDGVSLFLLLFRLCLYAHLRLRRESSPGTGNVYKVRWIKTSQHYTRSAVALIGIFLHPSLVLAA